MNRLTAISGILIGLIVVASTSISDAALAESMTPMERVTSTPKGQLTSPYTDVDRVAAEGCKIFLSLDCNGCHGGGGGGGMAAPLTNPVWIYGDTLFRLIALGTGSLSPDGAFQKQGFVRKGSERPDGALSS
jgi:mono/diheme cytochrome c family protein